MELLYTLASIAILVLVTTELVAGVIIYRNRATVLPALRHFVRQLTGLDLLEARLQQHDNFAKENFARLERKINYIGRHTKFEREQLRKLGYIVPDESANLAGQERLNPAIVTPLRR